MRRASMNHPSAAKKPSSYSTVARAMRAKARRVDALSMLAAEHEEVSAMLAQFARVAADRERRAALIRRTCNALRIHMIVEEEVSYPAMRMAIDDGRLIDESRARSTTPPRC